MGGNQRFPPLPQKSGGNKGVPPGPGFWPPRFFGSPDGGRKKKPTKAVTDFQRQRNLDGRALTVNEARPREERPRGDFGGGGGGGWRRRDSRWWRSWRAEAAASATSVAAVAVVVKADPAEERNYERGVLRKQGALFLSRPDELSALVERDSPGQLLQNCNPFIWACYT